MGHNDTSKEKLLKAASDVFSEKGYGKAKVIDITDRSGLAKGTFYIYFKSKQQCLNELMLELVHSFREKAQPILHNEMPDVVLETILGIRDMMVENSEILKIEHFHQEYVELSVVAEVNKLKADLFDAVISTLVSTGVSIGVARRKALLIESLMAKLIVDETYVKAPHEPKKFNEFDDLLKFVIEL